MTTSRSHCAQCATQFDRNDLGPQGYHRYRRTSVCHACVSAGTTFGAGDSCEACVEPVDAGESA